MLRSGASRDDGNALLGQKAEQDLCRGLAVFFRQRKHRRLRKHFAAFALPQRGIGHVRHLLFVHPALLGAALAVEIRFDLVHRRDNLVVGDQVKKPVGLEVGNADGTDSAVPIQLFQRPPRRVVVGE